jgi:STE24 endopeptidase
LNHINAKARNKHIPDELKGIYKDDEYKKSQEYGKANDRFSSISSGFSLILTLLMFFFFGFNYINQFALSFSENPIISALIFFGVIFLGNDILNTPFALYNTFVIEERYGFNKMTIKTFILDKLKSWLLIVMIGGSLLALIIFLYLEMQEWFPLYAWIAISSFSIVIGMFYSNLIVPLFNKQTPFPEGSLREKLKHFAEKSGFNLQHIFLIDGSKRSTKSNAYFTGLGRKKRIVLYDTLLQDLSEEEIVSVLAHEVGHYRNKHTSKGIIISILQSGLMLFIFSILIEHIELSKAMGSERVSFQLGLIAFGILYSPLSSIIDIFTNILSRKHESQADQYAKSFGLSDDLISGLKKLANKNLSNLTPHPLYVFFTYSHPTLFQRIKALK